MTRIFLTGASGYIGGQVLHSLATTHPEYEIVVLNRDPEKVAIITKAFPNVPIVPGSLDDAAILESEASKADIVLHLASTSHLASAQSIHKGLTSTRRPTPAHWIQISGASLLAAPEIASRRFGEPTDAVYNDTTGLASIVSLIRATPSRAVDNLVLDADAAAAATAAAAAKQTPGAVRTALVPAGIIYGAGRGPVNARSVQVPELARLAIERGRAVQVGRGLAVWGGVHVEDLGALFVRLVERAVVGEEEEEREGPWGEEGVFFTSVGGDLSWGEISRRVAQAAVQKGYIKDVEVEQVSPEEADKLTPHGSVILGTNARVESRRAKELLGWTPVQKSLEEEIPETVEAEAKRLGVV